MAFAACRSFTFENATLPEPRDPDAEEIVRRRAGDVEARVFTHATLQFQRDDSNFVRILSGHAFEAVRLERHFLVVDGTPTLVVVACEVEPPDGVKSRGRWIRYVRRVGSGTMDAQRGTGTPPEAFSGSPRSDRWVRNVLLTEMAIPNRAFPD